MHKTIVAVLQRTVRKIRGFFQLREGSDSYVSALLLTGNSTRKGQTRDCLTPSVRQFFKPSLPTSLVSRKRRPLRPQTTDLENADPRKRRPPKLKNERKSLFCYFIIRLIHVTNKVGSSKVAFRGKLEVLTTKTKCNPLVAPVLLYGLISHCFLYFSKRLTVLCEAKRNETKKEYPSLAWDRVWFKYGFYSCSKSWFCKRWFYEMAK